ncbi:O-antigen ligase family protein [Candidatus Saccharibacteria bacterium]|nr:O-antigen ligase family protein [Candidatus Saccharibacteria bacterium]
MGLSTIFSDSILFTKIVGTAPSFLGLFTWLSMGVFALFNASSLSKTLFSYRTVQIVLGIVVVSLIINKLYVINGFRIPGLLLQSTTFAMYSVCSIVVTLTVILSKKIKLSTQRKVISIVALLIFNTTVMISHSRVSYISLIIIYILFAIKMLYRNYKISILFTFIAILIPLSMFINKNYFYRVSSQSVSYGTSYRLDLYKTSISDIAKNNTVIGNGPSTLPDAINDQNKAPEDIQSTLLSGYIFSSTHNLFIDLAYYFGLIAGLIVVLLTFLALFPKYILKNPASDLKIIFLVLLFNAIFNVPSLELTTLFIASLFSLLFYRYKRV